MPRRNPIVVTLAFVAFILPALAGCLDSDGAQEAATGGPGFDVRDADFYHSYYANDETWEDEFDWENPTGEAGLEVRNRIGSGSIHMILLDAEGARVFSQEWWPGTRGGEFYPGEGAPGEWTILLERRNAIGQFDVHVWSRGGDAEDA